MSRFQHMILLPREEYAQLLTSQNVTQPLSQKFQELQQDMKGHQMISDPYTRLVHEADTLEHMKGLKDQIV